MKRTRLGIAICALLAVAGGIVPSQAATQTVAVVAFQFVPSGWVAPVPLVANTAQNVGPAVPSFKKGDTIQWTNLDALPHQVFRISGPSSFSPPSTMAGPGASSSLATGSLSLGTYVYGCSIHAGMRGGFTLTA